MRQIDSAPGGDEEQQLWSREMLCAVPALWRGNCLEGMTGPKVRIINCKNWLELPLNESIEDKRGGINRVINTQLDFKNNSLALFGARSSVAHHFPSVINLLAFACYRNPFFAFLRISLSQNCELDPAAGMRPYR